MDIYEGYTINKGYFLFVANFVRFFNVILLSIEKLLFLK